MELIGLVIRQYRCDSSHLAMHPTGGPWQSDRCLQWHSLCLEAKEYKEYGLPTVYETFPLTVLRNATKITKIEQSWIMMACHQLQTSSKHQVELPMVITVQLLLSSLQGPSRSPLALPYSQTVHVDRHQLTKATLTSHGKNPTKLNEYVW